MSKPSQHGCKKCGSVVTVEARRSMDRIELVVKDGSTEERSGEFLLLCKKCRNPVLQVVLKAL